MNRMPVIILCALVASVLSGSLSAELQTASFVGAPIFAFVFGMIATVSGGTVLAITGTWVTDRVSIASRRDGSCV